MSVPESYDIVSTQPFVLTSENTSVVEKKKLLLKNVVISIMVVLVTTVVVVIIVVFVVIVPKRTTVTLTKTKVNRPHTRVGKSFFGSVFGKGLLHSFACSDACKSQVVDEYIPWRLRSNPNVVQEQGIQFWQTRELALRTPDGCSLNPRYLREPRSLTPKDTLGQPTLGFPKSRVHVTVFEDLKCPDCKAYAENVYPTIKQRFIDPGLIQYTVIPIGMISGSRPLALGSICAYRQGIEKVEDFNSYAFAHQQDEHTNWACLPVVIDFAFHVPGMNMIQFQRCIESPEAAAQLDRNMELAYEIMPDMFNTPGIYVNTNRVLDASVEQVTSAIESQLLHCGWV